MPSKETPKPILGVFAQMAENARQAAEQQRLAAEQQSLDAIVYGELERDPEKWWAIAKDFRDAALAARKTPAPPPLTAFQAQYKDWLSKPVIKAMRGRAKGLNTEDAIAANNIMETAYGLETGNNTSFLNLVSFGKNLCKDILAGRHLLFERLAEQVRAAKELGYKPAQVTIQPGMALQSATFLALDYLIKESPKPITRRALQAEVKRQMKLAGQVYRTRASRWDDHLTAMKLVWLPHYI